MRGMAFSEKSKCGLSYEKLENSQAVSRRRSRKEYVILGVEVLELKVKSPP